MINRALHELSVRTRRYLTRRKSYRAVFLGEDERTPSKAGEDVLLDLATFCGAYRSSAKVSPQTGQVDPLATALAEGRREVWLRIQANLRLPDVAVIEAMERNSND